MQARCVVGRVMDGRTGGAAVAVVLLLLVAAGFGAYWFLFRTSERVPLPEDTAAGSVVRSGGGGAGNASVSGQSVRSETAYPGDAETQPVSSTGGSLPVTSTGEVDWNARHAQLKEYYLKEFQEPKVGAEIKVRLVSGAIVEGRISDLTKDSISLRIGSGHATYLVGQLSPQTQILIFGDVYSEYASRKTLSEEKAAAAAALGQ